MPLCAVGLEVEGEAPAIALMLRGGGVLLRTGLRHPDDERPGDKARYKPSPPNNPACCSKPPRPV
jgi:hypothetical protein